MSEFWEILELEPTQDVSAIERTYAQKTLTCHREENPESFMELQKAYQAAKDYAEGKADGFVESIGESGNEGADTTRLNAVRADTARQNAGRVDEAGSDNPYMEHEAIRNFLELYTGKQRKDQKRWLDYFTSDAFLDAAWDLRFTALLLEHIAELEKEYPVNREFLIWLCVAYQFTVHRAVYRDPDGSERTELQFQTRTGTQFEGQKFAFAIAAKGPTPKYPKGNELAVFESFTEYLCLLSMAEKGAWSEQEIGEYSEIIGHYAAIYITDKCQQRGDMDYERHPAGLRLMTHFLRRDGLPEELYRIAWQKLNLETAVMGREKIFYGPMRELILEKMPELSGQQREKFTELRTAFHTYAVSTCKLHGENAQATDENIRKTEDFFAREDFQRALLDRRFVEEEMLHTWVNEDRCDYYLNKVIQFYTEHETAPCAQRVIDRAQEMLKCQKIANCLQKDQDAESAVTLASQMQEETVTPPRFPMEALVNLPDAVYARPDFKVVCRDQGRSPFWSKPVELLGKAVISKETGAGELPEKAVTSEKLEELLNQFANDRIERLEFSWNIVPPVGEEQDYDARRSLVFMKGSEGYVCLYFDDFRAKSYALLERPELYGKIEHNLEFVSFRRSRLSNQVIHRSFSSIRKRLDVIFRQVSWPDNVDYMAGNIWDYAINVSNGRSKYNLDKQLLADFPMERAHNRPDAPFYFFLYPESAACVDDQGSVETLEISQPNRGGLQQMIIGFLKGGFRKLRLAFGREEGSAARVDDQGGVETLEISQPNRGKLQQMMVDFLKGGFRKLRLTFGREEGRRRHIVLLQDGGRFLLAWLLEEKRTVEYHVADVSTYLDVEGKKYPKDIFQGRVTPAYLIHNGVTPLRNELELLLANLDHPSRITGRFAEYAKEKPVKARSYEELWAELVGDTLPEC